ncbi:MAG: GNAT family N-acetyltransferase, partial [Thermomicrobiales bacterium]|nr:GNAT family N-acetyltransferase [Thermomicrobiales bacterium]
MPILVCDLPLAHPPKPSPATSWTIRPCSRDESEELGALYFRAYDPGVACSSLEEAVADIVASFEGDYGELIPEASLVAVLNGELIGAVMVVWRAPWPDVPDCPFVIELFTARECRRVGVARSLMLAAMNALTTP